MHTIRSLSNGMYDVVFRNEKDIVLIKPNLFFKDAAKLVNYLNGGRGEEPDSIIL